MKWLLLVFVVGLVGAEAQFEIPMPSQAHCEHARDTIRDRAHAARGFAAFAVCIQRAGSLPSPPEPPLSEQLRRKFERERQGLPEPPKGQPPEIPLRGQDPNDPLPPFAPDD